MVQQISELPIEKAKKGVPLAEGHKKKISEALKKKYGKDVDYDTAFIKFIEEVKPTISIIANSFVGKHSKEELVQETITQMYEKFEQYIPKLSNPNTFTAMCTKQIMFWMNKPDNWSFSEWKSYAKMKSIKKEVEKDEEEISLKELAKRTGISEENAKRILEMNPKEMSLETTSYDDTYSIGDFITGDNTQEFYQTPEETIEKAQFNAILDSALNSLSDTERKILECSYGFKTGEELSDNAIGRKLKISSMYVGVLKKKALQKLREYPLIQLEKSIDYSILKKYIEYINYLEKVSNKLNESQQLVETIKSLQKQINEKLQVIEKTKQPEDIRIRQRDPKIFDRKTLRTIDLTKSIKAVYGCLPNDSMLRVQTLIFNRNPQKGEVWSLKKSKEWVNENKQKIKISIDVKDLLKKCQDKIETIK
jgi:DNA-directed RNA polymerase specialized sigma subunit